MAAIDVLFKWSPSSERMHQVVLAGLLENTRLLEMLGIEGIPEGVKTETQNRLYDFSVELQGRRNVHIELKIDSPLDVAQISRQIGGVSRGDLLMYVLLGNTRFTCNRDKIEQVRKSEKAPDIKSIRVVDLDAMLGAVTNLAQHSVDPDHHDLAVAYASLLREILSASIQYETKALADWSFSDWYPFFAKLDTDFPLSAIIQYVANPRGGFIGCLWGWMPLADGVEAYLQLEEERLCFKVAVELDATRAKARQAFSDAVLNACKTLGFNARRPTRFGTGKYMTVALLDGDIRSATPTTALDWEYVRSTIVAARKVLQEAVHTCRM